MAPSATAAQTLSSKVKRPMPPGIQTNGINSSTSTPSPSLSASRLPSGSKYPPNSATSNGVGNSNAGARSANRTRRDAPGQLLGRGQRNSSVGLRSASLGGELAVSQVAEPQPYIKSDEYILKRYRGSPPSLIVHLHATHFRFDQQEGSFSYKSPMRTLIEHMRLRTIPHDLMEFFTVSNIPFYEGCMIVQVYDHKSTTSPQDSNRVNTGTQKAVPFSVHNYNQHLTPSPYVPFPKENLQDLKGNGSSKSSEQKDKENMPAPAAPADGQRSNSGNLPKKPKVSTIVLHPTPISNYADMAIKASEARPGTADGRVEPRQETNGSLSATVPLTPSTTASPTLQTSMAPPAKRQKRSKTELDASNVHAVESQITLAITAPLVLDPVSSAAESAMLLESLAHPMHSEKPPSPKTRKRTVAEMAADEALAVSQERYMLCLDERLSSSTTGAQGGANPADGDGQAGGASFEPRFERFKTLENIRIQHEENKKAEKARQAEIDRKNMQDRERERLRQESEKRDAERMRQQAIQQEATRRQQEAHRRVLSAAAAGQQPQPNLPGAQSQAQGQHAHAHPQQNNIIANGIQGQPQRFHQQVSQGQMSSPIVRNGTPQSHSSPIVNNGMGNIQMQHSTSSMGGSPPRPGSAVHQNHPQMGGPTAHNMTTQRSQQSHAGTPRMPSATPNLQSTPLNRQMSQTPRMSQVSPLQGPMGQVPHVPQMMVNNGQQMNMTPAQQQQFQQQQQQAIIQQRLRQQQAAQAIGSMNGQPMSQQQMMHAQQILQHQANQMNNTQLAQNYQAQIAAMQRAGGMPPNMNFNNSPGMQNMQQMHQMQQLQQMQRMQQLQQQQQQHNAQVAQGAGQQYPQQMNPQAQQQLMVRKAVQSRAQQIYQQQIPQLHAQYPSGIPEDVHMDFRRRCQQTATAQVQQMSVSRMQQQQQMMAAQHGGMPNGMGMQRPQ